MSLLCVALFLSRLYSCASLTPPAPLCLKGSFNGHLPAFSWLCAGTQGQPWVLRVPRVPRPCCAQVQLRWLPAWEREEGRQVSLTTLSLSSPDWGKCWPRLCDHSADGRGPWGHLYGTEAGEGGILSPSSCWLGDPAPSPAPASLLDLLSLPILTSFLSLEAPEAIPAPTILLFSRTLPRANKDTQTHWHEPVTCRLARRPRQLTNPA